MDFDNIQRKRHGYIQLKLETEDNVLTKIGTAHGQEHTIRNHIPHALFGLVNNCVHVDKRPWQTSPAMQ